MSNLLMKYRKRTAKYIVIFCVKEANSYNFIKAISIKPDVKTVKHGKDKEYKIDIENHTYRKGNTLYYCVDINSQQIFFEQLKETEHTSPRMNKMIMSEAIIEQLARASSISLKHKYDYGALAIGLIIGGLLCLIVGFAIGFLFAGGF